MVRNTESPMNWNASQLYCSSDLSPQTVIEIVLKLATPSIRNSRAQFRVNAQSHKLQVHSIEVCCNFVILSVAVEFFFGGVIATNCSCCMLKCGRMIRLYVRYVVRV